MDLPEVEETECAVVETPRSNSSPAAAADLLRNDPPLPPPNHVIHNSSSSKTENAAHTNNSTITKNNKDVPPPQLPPKIQMMNKNPHPPSSSSSSPSPSSSCCNTPQPPLSRTLVLRVVLVMSLIVAAVVCAVGSYLIIRGLEDEVGEQTYSSIAASALQNAQALTLRKVQGGVVLSSVLSFAFPDPHQWPLVGLDGFADTAGKIAQLTSTGTLAFMPLVVPEMLLPFEAHAAALFAQTPGYPPGTGESDFGHVGVWRNDPEHSPYADGRVHHTPHDTDWGTKHPNVSFVVLQHNIVPGPSLMFDIHSEVFRGTALDSLLDCGSTGAQAPPCGVVTDWIDLISRPGPAGLLYQPVYPADDPSKVVGVVGTSIHWEEVLTNIVPNYVDGLTCVVSTRTNAHTYIIHNGIPVLLGPGDLHDANFEVYAHSIILNDFATGATASVSYTLTVYPTSAMFDEFHTSSPQVVAVAFLGVIVLCTAIFLLYDFLMRHEAHEKTLVLEMKRRFVRYISHEIRTPLNTVCMGLDLLESEFKDKKYSLMEDVQDGNNNGGMPSDEIDEWCDVLSDVKENAHTAVGILTDLLNYDRIEAGAMKLEVSPVSMWAVVEQTVNQFKIQAANRKINLNLTVDNSTIHDDTTVAKDGSDGSIDTESLIVIGDDTRLRQVIRNLISNALKFTPPDGSVDVSASYFRHGLPDAKPLALPDEGGSEKVPDPPTRAGSIRVVVKDTGAGMTKDQLSMLGTDFCQFDANKLQHGGGSGLGLAIAQGIIDQHHGTLKAQSDGLGMGTTFTLDLPLYDIPRTHRRRDTETKTTDCSTSMTIVAPDMVNKDVSTSRLCRCRRVLIVEDAESSQKMLIRLLERDGHTCVGAGNGQKAVDAIAADLAASSSRADSKDHQHVPFDTILMDFEMPVMNGPEAIKRIRELGYTAACFGVTGNVMKDDVDFFLKHGADEVLTKPINMEVLREHWNNRH